MSYAYTIVGGKEHELSLYFMLNALLQSRIDVGEETTDDEDVNVYLASLLHSLVDSALPGSSNVSSYDVDIAGMAEVGDLRDRYRLYRSNADHAMIAAAVFGQPWFDRRSKASQSETECDRIATKGKRYYVSAASIEQKLKFGASAVSEVLTKLSERFELYCRILGRVRTAHLNLFGRMSAGEMFHLERDAQEGAKPALIRQGRDRFIDAYSEWMSVPSRAAGKKVNRLAESLGNLDSNFRFEEI
jgi:hypothetical protein